jgi:prepilin-type N-terminal cleavage/methylation domain-containing protein
MTARRHSNHPVAVVRRATRRRVEGTDEAGFTLIELLVTVVILPLVIGGIATALLAVFGLQNQTQNRIGDSNDAQVGSANFNKDVQSAEYLTTASFTSAPGCGGGSQQTQLLGLEWAANSAVPPGTGNSGGFDTVVSWVLVAVPVTNEPTEYDLVRQECTAGPSTTPTSTMVISRDFPDPTSSTPFQEQCPVGTPSNCLSMTPASVQTASQAGWASAQGVTNITFYITEPGSGYSYTLTGLPGASTSTNPLTQLQPTQPAGCSFANAGTGTYARQLCFADFTNFTDPSSTAGCQQMTLPIEDSSDFLQFCVIATPQNTVRGQSIPTYYNPGGTDDSEAYLGNNGFYTGIPGAPALSQRPQTDPPSTINFPGAPSPAYTVITFTNVEVTNAVGDKQSGWTLVTGDAESTDTNGWLEFQNNTPGITWSILPNSSTSLWGNSCYDGADTKNTTPFLPGGGSGVYAWTAATATDALVGTPSNGPPATQYAAALPMAAFSAPYATGASGILCEGNAQLNKTGALMVAAPEPANSNAAQSVTVTLQGEGGTGYQAIFLGVLL